MAADSHNGSLKNAVIRERLSDSRRNSTHTSRKLLLSGGHLKICVVENPIWRSTAVLDFKNLLKLRNGWTDFHETSHTEVVSCRMDETYGTTATFQY
jgi:hypothetical protein